MNFPIYAVRDAHIGFGLPVLRDNDAVASRAFEFDCTRDDSPYAFHPDDYSLYYIGMYDTGDGTITGDTPRFIASANDFVVR